MDSSYEEVEESMLELVQRAEAFLSTYSSTSESSSSNNESSSDSSSNNSSHTEDLSFTTADGNSSLSSRNDDSSASESPSSVSLSSVDRSVSSSTTSGGTSRHHDFVDGNSSANSSVASLERTSSEDCVVVVPIGGAVPIIDLCSPRVQRELVRRIANAAPIVDSITLDDTINEPEGPLFRAPDPPAAVVVFNEYLEGPPAKRPKANPPVAALDVSQSSEPKMAVSCPICYDSIFRKQASSTICGHLFCHACISQEIQLRMQCPLCKRMLAWNHIHPIYFN